MKCFHIVIKKDIILCIDKDTMLRKPIKTCEWWNICGVGIKTSHNAIVCNQWIFMATLGLIWKNPFVKVEGGKDFLCF